MFIKYNTLEEVQAADTAILTNDKKLTHGVDPISFFIVQTRVPGFTNLIWSVTDVSEPGNNTSHYAFSLINEPATLQNSKDVVIHTGELVRDIPELSHTVITVDKRYIKTKFTSVNKLATIFIDKKFNRDITLMSIEAARRYKPTLNAVSAIVIRGQKSKEFLKSKIVVLPIDKIGDLQYATNCRELVEAEFQVFAEILMLNK